ncbi:MAG: hypothetical protein QGG71_21745 [Pirellulaceae bacterium]|nr:hypothetical protein [Pirellulaceae bacterium]
MSTDITKEEWYKEYKSLNAEAADVLLAIIPDMEEAGFTSHFSRGKKAGNATWRMGYVRPDGNSINITQAYGKRGTGNTFVGCFWVSGKCRGDVPDKWRGAVNDALGRLKSKLGGTKKGGPDLDPVALGEAHLRIAFQELARDLKVITGTA